jgi:hypothetical protein
LSSDKAETLLSLNIYTLPPLAGKVEVWVVDNFKLVPVPVEKYVPVSKGMQTYGLLSLNPAPSSYSSYLYLPTPLSSDLFLSSFYTYLPYFSPRKVLSIVLHLAFTSVNLFLLPFHLPSSS